MDKPELVRGIPITLEPGKTYVLRTAARFRTDAEFEAFRGRMEQEAERLGVKFFIIEGGTFSIECTPVPQSLVVGDAVVRQRDVPQLDADRD